MNVFERCKTLDLKPDQFIVEGSGVLDALGIRESRDLDIVVDQSVFEELIKRGFKQKMKDDDPYLEKGEIEVWLTFNNLDFTVLMESSVQIDGYYFANLEFITEWKQHRGLEKDKRDLVLIEKFKAALKE